MHLTNQTYTLAFKNTKQNRLALGEKRALL